MKTFLLLLIAFSLHAQLSENVHSSASIYAEHKDYSHSLQKKDGNVFGLGADIHYKNAEYKLSYERGGANTKQPPMKKDLEFQKLFLRYAYKFQGKFALNINYLSVLEDNIALTDGGKIYGAGVSYFINKTNNINTTQYYSDYKDFNTYQTDLQFIHKMTLKSIKLKLTAIGKYIHITESKKNNFTKNAQRNYTTAGFKAHLHYKSYHFGAGAYFGKRAFAIMQEGFKLQHHAMEFDRTYAIAFGKTFSDLIVRVQYNYMRATELPRDNAGVLVNNYRLIANYKF